MEEIYEAVKEGNLDEVQRLLDAGVDVNAKTNIDDDTPLHLAARMGKTEVVNVLLSSGAQVNAKRSAKNLFARWLALVMGGEANETPLHDAAAKGHTEVVKVLLGHGSDVNAKTRQSWTPLYNAVAGGFSNTIHLLQEDGASTASIPSISLGRRILGLFLTLALLLAFYTIMGLVWQAYAALTYPARGYAAPIAFVLYLFALGAMLGAAGSFVFGIYDIIRSVSMKRRIVRWLQEHNSE